VRLERYEYTDLGVHGKLFLPDGTELATLEPPWVDNEPFVSCIPEGIYTLVPHDTEKYPDTWALVGNTVSHFPAPDTKRSSVVFHSGNHVTDTAGCVLVADYREGYSIWNHVRGSGMSKLRSATKIAGFDPVITIINTSGREIKGMGSASKAEVTPSKPGVGAQRTLQRTIGGWVFGGVVTLLLKVGLDLELTEGQMTTGSMFIGSAVVSPFLAWVGKKRRQADKENGILGELF
jgi:hypothetical protein